MAHGLSCSEACGIFLDQGLDQGSDQGSNPCPLQILFFFNDTATTEIYTGEDTLSLHDALPISHMPRGN